jgi:hypothetical protein
LKDKVDAFVYGLIDLARHWDDVDYANKKSTPGSGEEKPKEERVFAELPY